jgi:glycerol-3-phosphate O-acyltransferase
VPVALNYDWVLEDTILTSAARVGERRFKARIGVVMGRVLRQLWLWMTGRYHRFGYAAVTFGRPLSLRQFAQAHQAQAHRTQAHRAAQQEEPEDASGRHLTQDLATELLNRIGSAVPVLPVPMAAWLLLQHGPMRAEVLSHRMTALRDQMGLRDQMAPASVHHHSAVLSSGAESAVHILLMRGLIARKDGLLTPVSAKRDLLAYYANSIAHLVPQSALGLGDGSYAAGAKENSAPAGS